MLRPITAVAMRGIVTERQRPLEISQKTKQIERSLKKSDRRSPRMTALSTNGQNVKIITSDGKVTLRGPVKSAKEKADIAAKATQIAGVKQVDNQLEVTN